MQFGWHVDHVDSITPNTILCDYVINGITENSPSYLMVEV